MLFRYTVFVVMTIAACAAKPCVHQLHKQLSCSKTAQLCSCTRVGSAAVEETVYVLIHNAHMPLARNSKHCVVLSLTVSRCDTVRVGQQ